MEIIRGDVKAVCDLVGRAILDKRADTVMLRRSGLVRPSDMHFCGGDEDWNKFIKARVNHAKYEAVDTALLFSLLHAIDSHQMPARTVFKNGQPTTGLIDLSSMLEDLTIAADIKFALKHIQGLIGQGRENGKIKLDPEIADSIKLDLMALCKDDYGVGEARRLCAGILPLFGANPPHLFVGANKEAVSAYAERKRPFSQQTLDKKERKTELDEERRIRRKI